MINAMKKLVFENKILLYALKEEKGRLYVIPPASQPKKFTGNNMLWAIDTERIILIIYGKITANMMQ